MPMSSKVLGGILGSMENVTKVLGKMEKWMAMVNFSGKKGYNIIGGNTKMT